MDLTNMLAYLGCSEDSLVEFELLPYAHGRYSVEYVLTEVGTFDR